MQERITTTGMIRKMNVGDVLSFPIGRADSIRTIIWTRLLPERMNGMSWSSETDKDKGLFIIKRDA